MLYSEPGSGKIDVDGILNDLPRPVIDLNSPGLFLIPTPKDLFAEEQRKSWDKSQEARCDFERKIRITRRSDVLFLSLWQKSLYGRTLTDIKGDDAMVDYFAENISPLIADVIGNYLRNGDWAICTTPKRRHLVKNFATLISERIADRLGIAFYEDVAMCHSKQRINAEFTLNLLPSERNIIIFDDIVTTGQTLLAMKKLLSRHEKNMIFFAGINNKL